MCEIGFSTCCAADLISVFIDNVPVGVIRKLGDDYAFVPGKSRKTMSADALRAIAVKIEAMGFAATAARNAPKEK